MSRVIAWTCYLASFGVVASFGLWHADDLLTRGSASALALAIVVMIQTSRVLWFGDMARRAAEHAKKRTEAGSARTWTTTRVIKAGDFVLPEDEEKQ